MCREMLFAGLRVFVITARLGHKKAGLGWRRMLTAFFLKNFFVHQRADC